MHSILDGHVREGTLHAHSARLHIHPTVSELIPTMLGSLKPLS